MLSCDLPVQIIRLLQEQYPKMSPLTGGWLCYKASGTVSSSVGKGCVAVITFRQTLTVTVHYVVNCERPLVHGGQSYLVCVHLQVVGLDGVFLPAISTILQTEQHAYFK